MKPAGSNLLGIYLNDHLAGATAGTELARRMARSHRGGEGSAREDSSALSRLAAEIAQDRSALLTIMAALAAATFALAPPAHASEGNGNPFPFSAGPIAAVQFEGEPWPHWA